MTYNYSPTQNNGRIASTVDAVTGENVSYTYDSLNRLIAASTSGTTGVQWGESYSYDGFGNLTSKVVTKGTAPQVYPIVNSAKNQARMSGDYGFDANGNWMGTSVAPNTWNVENQLIANGSVDGYGNPLTYTYDPFGKRVMSYSVPSGNPGSGTVYFYGVTGQRLGSYTVSCSPGNSYPIVNVSQVSVSQYFGARMLKPMDRLGSVRGNNGQSVAYFPWGEERTSTPDGTDKFATYFRDITSDGMGEDYASARYYNNNFGRFWSQDPSGASAADSGTPNSWNMYAYAGGDPINFVDPDGLDTSLCGDSLLEVNGMFVGTVSQALNLTPNVTILAETEFTEAGHGSSTNSEAEEEMIGAVIMNRWPLVNGYSFLYPTPGRPPLDVSAWGSPGGGIDSVTQNGQFAVWSGSTLTASAQNNLNAALNSSWGSKLCNDLSVAIGSAIGYISSPTVTLYSDPSTGLIPLAFNSANLTTPSYMDKIGSFGDANVFYGAPAGDFSAFLTPIKRPTKPPHKPGRRPYGPLQVQ